MSEGPAQAGPSFMVQRIEPRSLVADYSYSLPARFSAFRFASFSLHGLRSK